MITLEELIQEEYVLKAVSPPVAKYGLDAIFHAGFNKEGNNDWRDYISFKNVDRWFELSFDARLALFMVAYEKWRTTK